MDLISPLTEWAGLKGDALRHKREMLRVQREDVLAEIGYRVRIRMKKSPTLLKPVPLKFLIPFLEQASLEDLDSSLVDLWANLLVSASEDFNPYYIHFVSIISRISPSQGRVLKQIIGTADEHDLALTMDNVKMCFQWHAFEPVFRQQYEKEKGEGEQHDDGFALFVIRFRHLCT